MPRQKDTPCALCGTLMWRGSGSRPAGQMVCRACRKLHPEHVVALPPEGVRTNRAVEHYPWGEGSCAQCGRAMKHSKSSRPLGQQVCQPCRRADPGANRCAEVERTCEACSATFTARSRQARFCTPRCRLGARGGYASGKRPIDAERRRHYERNRPNTTQRGYGREWQVARRRVLVEETNCAFCAEPVDKALAWPNPMAASVDHKIRLRDGGTNARENLRLAHHRCNASDGGRSRGHERSCEVCGGLYWAVYARQRTCSRSCGAELRRRNAA